MTTDWWIQCIWQHGAPLGLLQRPGYGRQWADRLWRQRQPAQQQGIHSAAFCCSFHTRSALFGVPGQQRGWCQCAGMAEMWNALSVTLWLYNYERPFVCRSIGRGHQQFLSSGQFLVSSDAFTKRHIPDVYIVAVDPPIQLCVTLRIKMRGQPIKSEKWLLVVQSRDGKSPLHMTAVHGRFTRSQTLIQNGESH